MKSIFRVIAVLMLATALIGGVIAASGAPEPSGVAHQAEGATPVFPTVEPTAEPTVEPTAEPTETPGTIDRIIAELVEAIIAIIEEILAALANATPTPVG